MQFPQASRSNDNEIDERLASMTDQILADNKNELSNMNDADVMTLRQTLLRLRAAIWAERPDARTVARIQMRLQREWKNAWQAHSPKPLWRPQLVFAGALVVLLFAVAALWGSPAAGNLPGSADRFLPWTPLLAALGVIVIGVLLWIDHRR